MYIYNFCIKWNNTNYKYYTNNDSFIRVNNIILKLNILLVMDLNSDLKGLMESSGRTSYYNYYCLYYWLGSHVIII